MRQSFGIFGNCQCAEINRLLAGHRPFTERYTVLRLPAVHLMDAEARGALPRAVASLDVFAYQRTSRSFAPADTDTLLPAARGRVIELPSMWFSGHLPDMGNFAGYDYHSILTAQRL